MFYCDKCKEKNEWPDSWSKSYGSCEICKTVSSCNDVPSSYLGKLRKEREMKERDGMKYFTEMDLPENINPNK